ESVLDGILVVSPTGDVLHMNQRFQEIWKFPAEVRASGSDELALEWAAKQTVAPEQFRKRIAEIYSEPGKEFREEIEMKDGRVYDRFGGPIKRDGIHYGWVWTFRDITESKLADWALEATQEELRNHANRLEEVVETRTAALRETISDLETFSYSVSHDLRAPLRAMQSFAQILSEDCGQQISPEGREYIRRISSAAARMDRLIQDVLTYSKVSRVNLELKPVEVEKVFRDILELYPMFKEPEAKLEFVPPFPAVLAAEAVLTQCFANLIGNGLKFVAPGILPTMRIWSELAMDPGRVKIFFQDNGVGIAEGAHEVIFGIFQRLNVQFEGTGIGLAIVKKGVERMGGSVGLISSPGKGSLFWLELKVAERSPAPPPGQQKKN
ncbi:MAG: hypothetical protein JWM04_1357, partial [Verrucomicrobiales bacterium]|nr:hypothetical protein [Verrucomicrobiales bacterium]